MAVDEMTSLAPIIAGSTSGSSVRETRLSEDCLRSKYSAAAAASTPTPTHSDEVIDAKTAPSVATTTAKATIATASPVRVAMTLEGRTETSSELIYSLPVDNGPLIDDEPYIDDGLEQDDAFAQRDRRVQNWLAQQCRFSLVFGESEQDMIEGLHGNFRAKGKGKALPEHEYDDEDRGLAATGAGALGRQRSYLDSLEILGSTPAATTAPTTVTRTSSGSSRQQGSSHVFSSPAIPSEQSIAAEADRADSPLLGFGSGPEPAHDHSALDVDGVDPLTRPAHNWVRELPRDDGVSASEWGRFAVRFRDDPCDDFNGEDRNKPLPMLPPPSTRTSPIPDELPEAAASSVGSTPGADDLPVTLTTQIPQERTPSAAPSHLPAASVSLTVAPVSPQLSTFLSISPSRPISSYRSSAHPSAHPSPLPAMQATPLPPSSPPTRRQSRAVLNAFMTHVDFGDDYNTEQYLSGLPSSPAGNRNTLVANPNPAGSANTPNAHSLATVRSRSGSVGLRNAVYINSEEVIERLDALLLRSPTETHQNVEDELEDMTLEIKDELAGRINPLEEVERDDCESSDSKSEGRLEAEEMLGELGLGLKGLEDDRLHEMPALARETELHSIVRAEEEPEQVRPQLLDTLHEHGPDSRATDVTSSVITAPAVVIASPVVPSPAVPVTRSRTSSISLAAAGRLPSGPPPAVLHQMHTRENSSASSSRRMSPSSPSAKLSRSQSQSSPQLHHQIQHAHSLSHTGFSRAGTPSSPSSRSNSNHGHSHASSVAVNHLSGHSSNYSNGSIVIPGIASSVTGHSRSSSSILLATPATSSIYIVLPVQLPPAEPGAPRPTRPPPAPPLDLGPSLDHHDMSLSINGSSLGLDIASDEFYGDVLGSEESSQKSFVRRYQDSEKDGVFTPEHVEQYDGTGDETLMGTAFQHGDRPGFEEHGDGEDPEQLLQALGLEDRMEEFRGIKFPSAPSIREEDEEPYGESAVRQAEPVAYPSHSADVVDVHGKMGQLIGGVGHEQDDGQSGYPDRPTMQRSMSRWSLTSSTMGDDAPKDKKEVKKKKSRKSFPSPFAAASAEATIDGPSTPSAQDGNEFSTPVTKDGNATTSPTSGEKKVKRGRLASLISRLSGVGQNGGNGSPNHSGPTTPSSAVPPVPSLPPTPSPYVFGVSGYGMDLSDIVLPKPSLRQGTLMPSPDIAESAPKKLNTKASRDKLVELQHTSRQRSNSAADLLRKMPGNSTSQSPSGSSSNLQQVPAILPPPVNTVVVPHPPAVDPRRPGLVKSMSTPAIGPSALRPLLQTKKAPIQIQTQIPSRRGRPTIIFDESMPPTPSSAATSLINEDDEEDYGIEMNEHERLRREREYDERWVAHTQVAAAMEPIQPHQQGIVEAEPYTPPLPTKAPTITKPTMLGMVASHGHVVDIPPAFGDFDQKRRLRSLSNLTAVTHGQGLPKSPPASASTSSFASHQKTSGSALKSAKGSGFRGFVGRMGLGGSNANNASNASTLHPTSPRSPSTDALQSFPSPPPSAGFTQPTSHSPTTSLSFNGSQSPGVFSTGILGKKTPKRILVISGVAISDTSAYEAVKSWCEDFGAVREITRADNGCLYVDFESAETAETVCRIHAQVFIKGAGSVQLSWYSKKRPL